MPAEFHGLRFRRRKIARLLLVLKTCGLVRAVAKGLVRGMSTAAKSECGASGETVWAALHIDKFAFAFNAQRAVISNDDLQLKPFYPRGLAHGGPALSLVKLFL